MSNRFAWLLGVAVVVLAGLLVACGSKYNPSSNGLLVVGSQGSDVLETFSFDLANGHSAEISNPPSSTGNSTCLLNGLPSSIVLDPAGAFAYTIIKVDPTCDTQTTKSQAGILAFQVNSDGTIKQSGSLVLDPNPISLAMDSKGKFLFVAEGLNSTSITNATQNNTPCTQTQTQFGVCVYAIGSGASLTPVPMQATFSLPTGFQGPNMVAVASTPTLFPQIGINGVQNSVCTQTGLNPPTNEFLYAADSQNNVVWEFMVDPSSGTLGNPPGQSAVAFFPGKGAPLLAVPSGVAVDPCNRFVYVTNMQSNQITGYAMCNGSATELQSACQVGLADGSLVPLTGSPFSLSGGANGPGPLVVDPFGNYVYVLETLSNQISSFRISPVSGNLTALSAPVVGTSTAPRSIAIRGDDSWLFVTNYVAGTISQFSITPATGALVPQPEITTDNLPWGVAVK